MALAKWIAASGDENGLLSDILGEAFQATPPNTGLSKTTRSPSGFNFASRASTLTQKKKANGRILPFLTTYHQTLMEQWSLIIVNNIIY